MARSKRRASHADGGMKNITSQSQHMTVLLTRALKYVGVLALAGSAIGMAQAEEMAACVARKSTFDGVTPLTYAKVAGAEGSKVIIHREYPKQCSATEAAECNRGAYVVPGDEVAIAKQCGDWGYVQYIGQDDITVGWARAASFTRLEAPIPSEPPTGTVNDEAKGFRDHPERYKFELAQGRTVPVCEAYLQRLNQTEYWSPPYCGRPENDQVPGFSRLHRVALSGQETASLYPHLAAFEHTRSSTVHLPLDPQEAISAGSGGAGPAILAWRYDPNVDIQNDGAPDNVVIWEGMPVGPPPGWCGDTMTSSGTELSKGQRSRQLAFIAGADTKTIDDERTLALFQHPHDGFPHSGFQVLGFIPIGSPISVFKYRDLTYFDTFFEGGGWPDFYGHRARLSTLDNHLAVFLHRNGATRQVCEYIFHDHRRPRVLGHDTEAESHE